MLMTEKRKKPIVYLETSVISYYTAQFSAVLKIAAEQQITRDWWERALPQCHPVISIYVIDEITKGNEKEAQVRVKAVDGFQIFGESDLVKELAFAYLKKLSIPKKAEVDAFHLASSAINETDFLLSWNCKHIANAFMYPMIKKINEYYGLKSPIICTPRELMEV
jgi:hypothetical protein